MWPLLTTKTLQSNSSAAKEKEREKKKELCARRNCALEQRDVQYDEARTWYNLLGRRIELKQMKRGWREKKPRLPLLLCFHYVVVGGRGRTACQQLWGSHLFHQPPKTSLTCPCCPQRSTCLPKASEKSHKSFQTCFEGRVTWQVLTGFG